MKSYYVYQVSLEHNVVFKMVKVYFSNHEIDYTDENCMDDILVAIKILEQEGVTLTFDPDLFVEIPFFRPKLPG